MGFEEWLDQQTDSEIGRQYLRCRERLARHYYPLMQARYFPDQKFLSHDEEKRLENAVSAQLMMSNNVILWMAWSLTDNEILKAAGMPTKQNEFCKLLEINESLPRQWRRTYKWLDQWLFMAQRTGKEILTAVSDDILTEIGELALTRGRKDQLGWAKLAVDVTGLKAPTVTKNIDINVAELSDDEIDAIAAGEDPAKVLK